MNYSGFTLTVMLVLVSVACGQKETGASKVAEDQFVTNPDLVSLPDGVLSGEQLFTACIACHSISPGADHRVGPNLFGIDGQGAASRPGYSYSEALQESGIVWNSGTLMAWIIQTEGMVPGTWMAYYNYLEGEEVQRLVKHILEQQ